jgi:16S rRNA (cytosine1402-N4)-methyltransferase
MGGVEIAKMESDEAREHAEPLHVPVLGEAVIDAFRGLSPALATGWLVDGTVGAGGHSAMLLEALPDVRVLGVDQDPAAVDIARERLVEFGRRARVHHARASQLSRLVRKEQIEPVVGMLFDVGVSSMQIGTSDRGFSFQSDGPLDMRMDPTRDRTAADIVNSWDESDLADLFFYEGGETRARQVARAIVEGRRRVPFRRTLALADVIARAAGGTSASASSKIHPATRTFQALRRAVNEESEELLAALGAAERWIVPGGRLAVISFHSGEDREVKRFFAQGAREGRWSVLTKKPIESSVAERRANPRSRSARLRIAERLGGVVVRAEPLLEGGSA